MRIIGSQKYCVVCRHVMRHAIEHLWKGLDGMKSNSSFVTSIVFITLVCLLSSCKDSATSVAPIIHALPAPSRNLSASEIMKLENITSIHYIDYYLVTVNGRADTGFHPEFEFHIDTSRERMNQYYLGTPDWNITVYDLSKDISWNLYSGVLRFNPSQHIIQAYEGDIQAFLGSWLNSSQSYIRSECIDNKLCDVFTDSTGRVEWVWRDHRLPIQRRSEWGYNGIYQVTYIRKKYIEVNISLPDSLFSPPR